MRNKISKLLFLALAAPSGVLLLGDSNTAVAATECRWLMTDALYNDNTAKCVAVGKYKILDEGRDAWRNFVTQTDNSGPLPNSANSFTLYHGKNTSSREDKCSPDSRYFYRVGNLVVGNNNGSPSNGLGSLGTNDGISVIGLNGIYNPNASDDPLYRVSSDTNVHTQSETYLRYSIVSNYDLGQIVRINGSDVGSLDSIMSISQASNDGLLSNWDGKSNYVFCHESEKQFVSLSPEVDFGFLDGATSIMPDAADGDYYEINRNNLSVTLSLTALESDSLSGFAYKKDLLKEVGDSTIDNSSITINLTNTGSVGTSWSYQNPGQLLFDGRVSASISGPGYAKYVTIKITYPKRFYKDENGIITASDEKYVKQATIYLAGDKSCSKWAFDNPDTILSAGTFGAAASATTRSFGYTHSVKNKDRVNPGEYPVLYVGPNDNPYFRLFYCNGGTALVSGSYSRFVGFSGNVFERPPSGTFTIGAETGQSLLYSKKSNIEYGRKTASEPYNMRSARPNTSSPNSGYGVYIEKPYNYVIMPTVQITTGSTGGQVPKGSEVGIAAAANILARKNNAVNPSVAYATSGADGGIKPTKYYYRAYTTNNPTADAKPHEVDEIPGGAKSFDPTSGLPVTATVNGNTGDYFCVRVYVTPADSHNQIGSINGNSTISFGSGWSVTGSGGNKNSGTSIMVSAPSCVTIGDYSRIHAENSSIYVNGQIKTLSSNGAASAVDHSIIARGKVSTPSIVAGGDASNPNSQQILKKIAGQPGNAYAASGEIGRTVSLIKMRYANQGASTVDTINDSYLSTVGCVQNAGTGKWTKQFTTPSYDCSNDGVVRIHASDDAQIEALTIRKDIAIISSGNVTIAGDIGIAQNATNPSTLINAIISANNITIKFNVESIDAWLIADGLVKTCDKEPESANDCGRPIVFKGPVVANQVNLWRTTSSSGIAETFAPDVFDYYWANEKSDVGDLLKTTYIKEYSPRY